MDIFSQNSRPSFSSSSYQHGFHDAFSAGGGVALTAVHLPAFMHGHQPTEQQDPKSKVHTHRARDTGDDNEPPSKHQKTHPFGHHSHQMREGKVPN